MSKIYKARLNSGKDEVSALIRADSIAKARKHAIKHFVDVERATDRDIYEAGRNDDAYHDISSGNATDDNQMELPIVASTGIPVAQNTGD